MRKHVHDDLADTRNDGQVAVGSVPANGGLSGSYLSTTVGYNVAEPGRKVRVRSSNWVVTSAVVHATEVSTATTT